MKTTEKTQELQIHQPTIVVDEGANAVGKFREDIATAM
jgi:hypothetical protein